MLKLKEKKGVFELWAKDLSLAYVMVAKGELNQPHRVTIELYQAAGANALVLARTFFDRMVEAYTIACR